MAIFRPSHERIFLAALTGVLSNPGRASITPKQAVKFARRCVLMCHDPGSKIPRYLPKGQ